MSNICSVKKSKKNNCFDLTFKGLTKGEMISIKNALTKHSEVSFVAKDVLAYMNNGISDSPEPSAKDI